MKQVILIGCVAVSGLAAGCPSSLQPESDQAACVRVMTHTLSCMGATPEVPEVAEAIQDVATNVCAEIPETAECDWPAYADCVTVLSCDELMDTGSLGDETCAEILADFDTNGCYGVVLEVPEP